MRARAFIALGSRLFVILAGLICLLLFKTMTSDARFRVMERWVWTRRTRFRAAFNVNQLLVLVDCAFRKGEGGRNRQKKQMQGPKKGSMLTASKARLPYGENNVNFYFATFNSLAAHIKCLAGFAQRS